MLRKKSSITFERGAQRFHLFTGGGREKKRAKNRKAESLQT